MKLSELILKLQEVQQQLETDADVLITDGYRCNFYNGDYVISIITDCKTIQVVDIGIGGCDEK